MPRPIWEGNLSFGLVNIPVGLYTAVSRSDLRFRFLHKDCHTPIEYHRYCPKCKREVDWDEIVRGYEYSKGKFVILTPEDFEKADVELTKSIDIIDFVKLEEIPTTYFDRPYFLIPPKKAAKTYHLLIKALKEEQKVGIAKVVIKTREYLAAVIPQGIGLLLETMYFDDEVKKMANFDIPTPPSFQQKELTMAKKIVGQLTEKFDPTKYTDDYRQKLLAIIRQKAAGKKIVTAPKEEIEEAEFKDLMTQLKESMKEIEKSKK